MIDEWLDSMKTKFKHNQKLILNGESREQKAKIEFDLDIYTTSPELYTVNQLGYHSLPASLRTVSLISSVWNSLNIESRVIALTVTPPAGDVEVLLNYTPDGNVLMLWSGKSFSAGSITMETWAKLLHSEETGVLCPLRNTSSIIAHTGLGNSKSISIAFKSQNSVTLMVLTQ
jgi:hypothetical protein